LLADALTEIKAILDMNTQGKREKEREREREKMKK